MVIMASLGRSLSTSRTPTFMVVVVVLAMAFLIAGAMSQGTKSYAGHQVLRFRLPSSAHTLKLADAVRPLGLDVWAEIPASSDGESWTIDVRVPADHVDELLALGLPYEVMIGDLERLIQQERNLLQSFRAGQDFFSAYRSLDDFYAWMRGLAANYSNLVTYVNVGKTLEGRAIDGITITSKNAKKDVEKIGILYNAGQHAREWIGPMTVAYIANELITKYGHDDEITHLVDSIEWTIIPVVNADGYVYTFTTDRMWRKNRRKNQDSWWGCDGVDNNRNWGFQWNSGGSSPDTCAEDYMGPSAFSEPEELALAKFIKGRTNIKGYIDFHSYSQLWMNPWGYTDALPADDKVQNECSKACVEAIKNTHGTDYVYGNIEKVIYPASGSSVDWTYGVANVTFSFAVELRDTGKYGFLLPADQIVPTGEETMAAARAMANYMLNYYKQQ